MLPRGGIRAKALLVLLAVFAESGGSMSETPHLACSMAFLVAPGKHR
jgi:hypothetical protein